MDLRDEGNRDLAKLWTWAKESVAHIEGELARIVDALFGRDGTNGLNGRTKALEARVGDVEKDLREGLAWGQRVWEVERHKPGGCIGRDLVEALEERLAADRAKQDIMLVEMKKARLSMLGGLGMGLIAAAGSIVLELIRRAP